MPLRAQIDFGVKGGLQLAEMEFDASAFSKSNRVGFFVGPTIKISTLFAPLSIDVSALYDQRSLKVEDQTIHHKQLVIPAHARLGATMLDKIGVFIFAGPQLAFNLDDNVYQWHDMDDSKQFVMQNTTLGLNVGLGVLVGHLEGTVLYHVPFGKTADFTWESAGNAVKNEDWDHASSKTNAWRLSVTYYF